MSNGNGKGNGYVVKGTAKRVKNSTYTKLTRERDAEIGGDEEEPKLEAGEGAGGHHAFAGVGHVKKRAFLVEYSQTGNLSAACHAAGVTSSTGYNWRNDQRHENQAFLQGVQKAKLMAIERMEAEVHRRGVEGFEEPVFYQGREVGKVRKYSDNLLMFMLKGCRPEKYRERYEHTGPGGGPMQVATLDLSRLTDAELQQALQLSAKVQGVDQHNPSE